VGTRRPIGTARVEYPHKPARARVFAIAASIALVAAGLTVWMQSARGTYSTGVGEQRSITLSDGTTIELNARSSVRVRFHDAERTVHLLEGQALFHVAKDAARPFVVHSEGTGVRAVGTEFDVNRTRVGTIVTVLEGRVAVLPSESNSLGKGPGQGTTDTVGMGANTSISNGATRSGAFDRSDQTTPVYLDAGEQVTVTGTASHRPTHTDPAAATAWRQRKLQFASASLMEVADEYNRYHEQRLIVRDPRLESFHISGVFSATDNASLIAFLRQQPSLDVREADSEIEITSK
jgi:transmembrane sensor